MLSSLPVFRRGRVGYFLSRRRACGPHPTSLRSATLPEVGEGTVTLHHATIYCNYSNSLLGAVFKVRISRLHIGSTFLPALNRQTETPRGLSGGASQADVAPPGRVRPIAFLDGLRQMRNRCAFDCRPLSPAPPTTCLRARPQGWLSWGEPGRRRPSGPASDRLHVTASHRRRIEPARHPSGAGWRMGGHAGPADAGAAASRPSPGGRLERRTVASLDGFDRG